MIVNRLPWTPKRTLEPDLPTVHHGWLPTNLWNTGVVDTIVEEATALGWTTLIIERAKPRKGTPTSGRVPAGSAEQTLVNLAGAIEERRAQAQTSSTGRLTYPDSGRILVILGAGPSYTHPALTQLSVFGGSAGIHLVLDDELADLTATEAPVLHENITGEVWLDG